MEISRSQKNKLIDNHSQDKNKCIIKEFHMHMEAEGKVIAYSDTQLSYIIILLAAYNFITN